MSPADVSGKSAQPIVAGKTICWEGAAAELGWRRIGKSRKFSILNINFGKMVIHWMNWLNINYLHTRIIFYANPGFSHLFWDGDQIVRLGSRGASTSLGRYGYYTSKKQLKLVPQKLCQLDSFVCTLRYSNVAMETSVIFRFKPLLKRDFPAKFAYRRVYRWSCNVKLRLHPSNWA